MATGDLRLGLYGEFYYGTAGSTPTTEAVNIDKVALKMSKRTIERIRRKKRYVGKKITVTEASLTFEIDSVEGDAFLAAIKTAFHAAPNTTASRIALYGLDAAAASGGEGLDADWQVTGLDRDEDNSEAIAYSVTCELNDELRDPTWG